MSVSALNAGDTCYFSSPTGGGLLVSCWREATTSESHKNPVMSSNYGSLHVVVTI